MFAALSLISGGVLRHANCVGKNCLQVALNLHGTLKKYCRTMGWSVNAKFTTSTL
jgi:hypothetical protein